MRRSAGQERCKAQVFPHVEVVVGCHTIGADGASDPCAGPTADICDTGAELQIGHRAVDHRRICLRQQSKVNDVEPHSVRCNRRLRENTGIGEDLSRRSTMCVDHLLTLPRRLFEMHVDHGIHISGRRGEFT